MLPFFSTLLLIIAFAFYILVFITMVAAAADGNIHMTLTAVIFLLGLIVAIMFLPPATTIVAERAI